MHIHERTGMTATAAGDRRMVNQMNLIAEHLDNFDNFEEADLDDPDVVQWFSWASEILRAVADRLEERAHQKAAER
jgi:hypothetical protein